MPPTTKDTINSGNFSNDLQGHVQNIYSSAQYIEQNYQSPDWKNNVDDPQILQQGHLFAQDIMKVCDQYKNKFNLDFSNLVGSGTGSPGDNTGGGSGGGSSNRRT